jgi:integrase
MRRYAGLPLLRKPHYIASNPDTWTPREQRHTFVSVLSDEDMPIEKISDLVGHKDQTTTETVYRHQIRPVVLHGAEAMDRIFPED